MEGSLSIKKIEAHLLKAEFIITFCLVLKVGCGHCSACIGIYVYAWNEIFILFPPQFMHFPYFSTYRRTVVDECLACGHSLLEVPLLLMLTFLPITSPAPERRFHRRD